MSELRMASSWPSWMTQPQPKQASAVIQSSPPRPWQLTLAEKLSQLHSECYEKPTSLTKTIQEFPALQGVAALDEIAYAVQIGWNVPLDIATERAREILQPGDPRFEGSRTTCPLSWSYATGGSTGEDLIIAQAVQQNVKASMKLPMNAMPHWRSIPTMSSLWQSVPGGAIARALLRPQQQ